MKARDKKILAVILIVALAAGVAAYFLLQEEGAQVFQFGEQFTGQAETPYGESLEIELTAGGETEAGTSSWLAAAASTSQNVYTVNGTYKSQEQVTLSYSLSVSYSNVGSITNVETSITAVDTADQSSYKYVLASNKTLSGASPISDSGSQTVTITQHLTDAGASTTSATIEYKVYCKVTAVGSISGATLTAEIPLTKFTALQYQQSTESASADVTPTVSVASWAELMQTPEMLAIVALVALIVIIAVVPKKKAERKRSSRKKKSSKSKSKA